MEKHTAQKAWNDLLNTSYEPTCMRSSTALDDLEMFVICFASMTCFSFFLLFLSTI